ncbi:MAG: M24 family metallopeptidase, partial [Candidatus Puniceispirillales bacterium]
MTDFPAAEYEARIARVQRLMAEADLPLILLASEAEIRYFTGFRTLFWQSPTRPWFVILRRDAAPLAIIPEIGAALMRRSGIAEIRTWSAPAPDDDGVSLLREALQGHDRIGVMMGHETAFRMPLHDLDRLRGALHADWIDATGIVRSLRMVKSEAEIGILEKITAIASDAFEALPGQVAAGQGLDQVFRGFKQLLLEHGAENVPYLVGGAGQPSYDDVISPPTATPLAEGDVLMLDTGASLQGYFCDFDRNYALGRASDAVRRGYAALQHATDAALAVARPGVTASGLYRAMAEAMQIEDSDVGRFGHGLGMQLTEWPSLAAWDETVLAENMFITLEPSIAIDGGGIMVTEENIVIRDGAPQWL